MNTEDLIGLGSRELMSRLDEVKDLTFTLAKEAAQKKATLTMKRETLKPKLAAITIELSKGFTGSPTMLRNKALSSNEYETAIVELAMAEKDFHETDAEQRGAHASIGAIQSIAYVVNQERKSAR